MNNKCLIQDRKLDFRGYIRVVESYFYYVVFEYHIDIFTLKQSVLNEKVQGPVVQSIVSLTSSLRGQLVKCFMTL